MNFIILDLECDTVFNKHHRLFVNEIIELGAVRLNQQLEQVDTFQMFVKSETSKKLSGRITELTGITDEEIAKEGKSLVEVLDEFQRFVNKSSDNLYLSWSDSDLHILFSNVWYLANLRQISFMKNYADLQKYVQQSLKLDFEHQIGLVDAANIMELDLSEMQSHRALDDCLICVQILKKSFEEKAMSRFIKDVSNPDFSARLLFKPYMIKDIDSPLVDKAELSFVCTSCGENAKQITSYKYKNRVFSAKFLCPKCNKLYIKRVGFKKTYDAVVVKIFVSEIAENTESN